MAYIDILGKSPVYVVGNETFLHFSAAKISFFVAFKEVAISDNISFFFEKNHVQIATNEYLYI